MAALYDSLILVLLILVFIGFVFLQKEPPVPPIIRPRIKETFQSGGSGSGSGANSLIRTTEMAAANATICNLQPLYNSLQCATYIARNGPTPPILDPNRLSPNELLTGRRPTTNYLTNAEGGSGLTLPSVAITASITNLATTVSITGGDPTPFVKPNDMIYFGYMIDVQGPYVVASVATNAIILTKKYVGPNLTNTILSVIPTSMSGSASQTTPVLEDVSNPSDSGMEPEVYSIGQREFSRQLQAQAACVGLGGTLATKAQLTTALSHGANWDELGWISDDGNNKYSPRQTPTPTLYVAEAGSGAAICYGLKPSAQTAYSGYTNTGNPVYPTPFSSTSYYDPPRRDIFGTVLPGTSYINTKNKNLPYALGIGDLVYINATCNTYDTDNGDGTCTGYDCRLGEVDLLDGTCQTYTCKDPAKETNNGDGTCSTAVVYQPAIRIPSYDLFSLTWGEQVGLATDSSTNYSYSMPTYDNVTYAKPVGNNQYMYEYVYNINTKIPDLGRANFSYPKGVLQAPYSYNIITNGTKASTYRKTSSNPSYKYPKSLGPYYVAENPAIGKIMIRSKTSGDLDANGKIMGITSSTWKLIIIGVSSICYGNGKLYYIDRSKKKIFYVADINNPTSAVDITGDPSWLINRYRLNTACNNINNPTDCNTDAGGIVIQRCPAGTRPGEACSNKDPGDVVFSSINVDLQSSATVKNINVIPSFNTNVPTVDPPGVRYLYPTIPTPLYPFTSIQDPTTPISWSSGGSLYVINQITSNNTTVVLTTTSISYVTGFGTRTSSYKEYAKGTISQISYDGIAGTVAGTSSATNVQYGRISLTNSPGFDLSPSIVYGINPNNTLTLLSLKYISHSNGYWVGIGGPTNNAAYPENHIYYGQFVILPSGSSFSTVTTLTDITNGIINPVEVAIDGYEMTVVVLNASGGVFFKNITPTSTQNINSTSFLNPASIINPVSIQNKVPPIGLQNVSISKVAYSTGGSGSRISLNKSVVGCSAGTYGPTCSPCDTGYYSPIGSTNQIPCTGGNLCIQTGQVRCAAGTYCPAGTTTALTCTAGNYCPAGTADPIPCTAGNYCPAGATAQTPCTAGNYCPAGTAAPVPCTAGNYCPAGTGAQIPCTAGNYCPAGAIAQIPCTAGKYCPAGTAAPVSCISFSTTTSSVINGTGGVPNQIQGTLISSIAFGSTGNMYIAVGNKIYKISSTGVNTATFTGGVGGMPTTFTIFGMVVDYLENLYFTDGDGNKIYRITSSGNISTIAGTGTAGYTDGPALSAQFSTPTALALDSTGDLYVADTGNSLIRRITSVGVVYTLPIANLNRPSGIAFDSQRNLYISDSYSHKIRKITYTGTMSVFAGDPSLYKGGSAGYLDATGTTARFNNPGAIAFDSMGNLYVADYGNHCVRKITSVGVVSTVALAATALIFSDPTGIAVDSNNNIYVADANNGVITKIVGSCNAATGL